MEEHKNARKSPGGPREQEQGQDLGSRQAEAQATPGHSARQQATMPEEGVAVSSSHEFGVHMAMIQAPSSSVLCTHGAELPHHSSGPICLASPGSWHFIRGDARLAPEFHRNPGGCTSPLLYP